MSRCSDDKSIQTHRKPQTKEEVRDREMKTKSERHETSKDESGKEEPKGKKWKEEREGGTNGKQG